MMNRSHSALSTAALLLCVATSLPAQSISIGIRGTGTLPTGAFGETGTAGNEEALIQGAKSGFGYGLDLGVAIGMLGVYAAFDRINFDCETNTCTSDGKYKLQGVAVGLRVAPATASRLRPFVRGGVTFNSLEGDYGASSGAKLTTDRSPGYEIGLGANVSLGGLLALTPQVRYVGQNLNARIPGVVVGEGKADGVNYFTFDLGLSFATPFGAKR
jgi:hypothetical protein